MSWFDSSFTFAKSALSQAQKSIDKVLDIKDDLPANTAEISHGNQKKKLACCYAMLCYEYNSFMYSSKIALIAF